MTAVREQLFDAIETALQTLPGVTIERMPSGDPGEFPTVALYDGGQRVIEGETHVTRHELTVSVEGYVETSNGPSAHAALNQLHSDVVAALMDDPTHGNLAELTDEGDLQVLIAELANKRRLAFVQTFAIQFTTARDDPSLQF